MSALAAIILAAGASTRMGRPKQLLCYEGESLLRRAVLSAEEAGCTRVKVVLGSNADDLLPELLGTAGRPIINIDWEKGMGTSIRCGMEALLKVKPDVSRVLLMLCDQPLVTAETILRLDAVQRETKSPVVVAAFDNTLGPPVVVTGAYVQSLMTAPDDRGAKAIWEEHPEVVVKVSCPEAAFDIDTPERYEALMRGEAARFR